MVNPMLKPYVGNCRLVKDNSMRWFIPLLVLSSFTSLVKSDDSLYQLGPDSVRQEHVPRGIVTEHIWKSDVFPGTIRR